MATELCSLQGLLANDVVRDTLAQSRNALICMPSASPEAIPILLTLVAPAVAFCALLVASAYYWTSLQTARDRDVQSRKQQNISLVRLAYTDHIRNCENKLADLARCIPTIMTSSDASADQTQHQLFLRVAVHNLWYILEEFSIWFDPANAEWNDAVRKFESEFDEQYDDLAKLLAAKLGNSSPFLEKEIYAREAVAHCLAMMASLERLANSGERIVREWDHEDEVAPVHARLPFGRVWARKWYAQSGQGKAARDA